MPNVLPIYTYTPDVVHVSIVANVTRSMALPLRLTLLRISIMAMYAALGRNKLNEL